MATKFKHIDEPDVPIPVRQLVIGTRMPCNVFVREKEALRVFFNKDDLYTTVSDNILREKGASEVFIHQSDSMYFDLYLAGNRSLNRVRNADSVAAFKEYSYRKEQHHQIDTTLLVPGTEINFSLFVLDKLNYSPVVEASDNSHAVISENMLNIAGDVAINKCDVPRYLEYISALQKSPELLEGNKTKIRAFVLKETSKAILQNFLADPKSGETIKEVSGLVNDMIDCIMEDRDAIYALLSLKGYDYYTYTHSVNVAALSIGLGVAINLNREDTEKLGLGGMCHDIGKSQISHEVLNKQGRLNPLEYNIIKSHVLEGEKIMREHKNFPSESFSAILQHHEKLSGNGYPYGLSGHDLNIFGKIAAIADCYDALTTRRPYKTAYTPFHALSIISKDTGDYDPDLLKAFIKMLGKIHL
ncbi:MAG: HD-GYP domain-containing protein [Dissulfurispiraceae bacterium]